MQFGYSRWKPLPLQLESFQIICNLYLLHQRQAVAYPRTALNVGFRVAQFCCQT